MLRTERGQDLQNPQQMFDPSYWSEISRTISASACRNSIGVVTSNTFGWSGFRVVSKLSALLRNRGRGVQERITGGFEKSGRAPGVAAGMLLGKEGGEKEAEGVM